MRTAFVGMKKGTLVRDKWYFLWGDGVVVARLKTRLRVRFPSPNPCWADRHGVVSYDEAHAKAFLVPVATKRRKR